MLFPSQVPPKKRLDSDEQFFLATKRSRLEEFRTLLRIGVEYIRGFRKLHYIGPAVTVFGSARFSPSHPSYELTRKIGRVLAEEGYVTMTGGGPGLMEAANRGAREAGGYNVGCTIRLPFEYESSPYIDREVSFFYFFVRKVMLVKYSYAFVFVPGGVGTLDEMMEALTLIQTGKIYDFPVVLVGRDYWSGMLDWMRETLLAQGAIDDTDLSRLVITDDPEEVRRVVRDIGKKLRLKLRAPAAR